jgi:hypothetical protein
LLSPIITSITKSNSVVLLRTKNLEVIFNGWESFLDEMPDKDVIEILRRRTITGIPCGNEKFIRKIGKQVGREIMERMRGGQKKSVK